MEFEILRIDYGATKFQVQKAIELVLHGPDLYDPTDPRYKGRVPNFVVFLNASKVGGDHDGTGVLTLPSRRLGERFATWLYDPAHKATGIRVAGRKLWFKRMHRIVLEEKRKLLESALYIGPEQEERRYYIIAECQTRLRVAKIQFGIWYRPTQTGSSVPDRAFSVEYERDYTSSSAAYIEAVYDHKLINIEVSRHGFCLLQEWFTHVLQLGDRFTEEECKFIKVKFTSIKKIGIGFDFGNPCTLLSMHFYPCEADE
jgi:RNA-dependent RNA polymerase